MQKKSNKLNLKKFFYIFSSALLKAICLLLPSLSFALTYELPNQGNIIGEVQEIEAKPGDTLVSLAEKYGIGIGHLIQANPHLKNQKLKSGTLVVIPSRFILPDMPREGVVLNLADMRLFYYHPDKNWVSTYPVGVGRQGWATPLGSTAIISKKKNPSWHPPDSIRREAENKGTTLPTVVPPGPHNPLGQYALYLGLTGILMHGTNQPSSIGSRSSHGCIRMFAADIEELFSLIPIGTTVKIIYEVHHNP